MFLCFTYGHTHPHTKNNFLLKKKIITCRVNAKQIFYSVPSRAAPPIHPSLPPGSPSVTSWEREAPGVASHGLLGSFVRRLPAGHSRCSHARTRAMSQSCLPAASSHPDLPRLKAKGAPPRPSLEAQPGRRRERPTHQPRCPFLCSGRAGRRNWPESPPRERQAVGLTESALSWLLLGRSLRGAPGRKPGLGAPGGARTSTWK